MVYIRRALIFSVAVFVANYGFITEVSWDGADARRDDLRRIEKLIEERKEYDLPPLRSFKGRLITVGPIDWVIISLLEFGGTVIAFIISIMAFFLHGKMQNMHYGSKFYVNKPSASLLPLEIVIVSLVAIFNCLFFCGD